MTTTLKMRFPLLLLLGIVFLALVCVSSGIAQQEQGSPCQKKCLQRCNRVNEASRRHECRSRCEGWPETCEEEEEEEDEGRSRHKEPGQRERGRQEGEKEEERREKRQPQRGREQQEEEEEERENRLGNRKPGREREETEKEERRPRHEKEEEEWRGTRRHEDPEERERLRRRRESRREEEESESQREERGRRRHEREEEEGSSSSSSESHGRRNPFFFKSNRFQTLFENENGRIRLLQRFDKRSNLFQNLQNYRLLEYRSKPHTLFLPQHTDADFILVVLSGRAILTVVNPDDRNSFNLERGDAIKLPAGTIAYLANRDDDEDLRVVDLAIPVNRPGQFQSFFTSSSQNQQSYFRGFSKDILEASLNTKYEEIERVLLEEQQERQQQRRGRKERQQSQEANDPIVKVSREQIEELSKNAKSSSKKSTSSESEPFNLRSRSPIYSNKFGKFFEITPEKNPQLQDLNLLLNSVEIREGALLLPHYNSRAFVIVVVNEGKGHLELVAQRNEKQEQGEQEEEEEEEQQEEQEEEERSRQLQRYRARLSPGDVFVIPSSHPVAINASSNLSLLGFGVNAENNQRNFLAGEDDNVISQIHKPVKELAFPGSAKEVDRLFDNQKQSHFASAQPQQREGGSQRRRSPLSSILGAFY